jgi:HEAT repeat protein
MDKPESLESTADQSSLLAQLLGDLKRHDWMTNWRTADALAELGDLTVPSLLRALESEDGYLRNGAAVALGKIGNKEAVQPLLRALQWTDDRVYEDDEDLEARTSAATALGRIGGAEVCAALLAELEKVLRSDSTLASYIVDAVGEIGDAAAVPALARLVEDRDFEIQKAASFGLAKLGPAGIRGLLDIAQDRSRTGRQFAVRAMWARATPECIPALIRIVKDRADDIYVRGEAARALGRRGGSTEVFPLLMEMLGDPNENVRSSALSGLGFLRDPRAFEAVSSYLESDNLRYVAIMALGELGDPRGCALLVPILRTGDHSASSHAATALGKLGCLEAIPVLAELLGTGDGPLLQLQKNAYEAALKEIEHKTARQSH